MKHLFGFLILALSAVSVFADFEQGLAAERMDDHVTAINHWKPLSAKGNPAAQYHLGTLYEYGLGVAKNIKTAIELYTKAARQGNAEAMVKLGDLHNFGSGFPRNSNKASAWYRGAELKYKEGAEKGQQEDLYRLALLYETRPFFGKQDYFEILDLLRKAAEQGYVPAYVDIGSMYSIGTEATPENQVESFKWFRRGADAGDAKSMAFLAGKYERGEGVTADAVQAAAWYRKSIESGNRWVLNHLGFLYGYGSNGFPKDVVLGYAYFKLACDERFFCRADRRKSAHENAAKIRKEMSMEQIQEGDLLAASWQLGTPLPHMTKSGLTSHSKHSANILPTSGDCGPNAEHVLRYTDSCINGNCVRTFGNGCQRHFQAPYCYDLLRGRWDWKPDGC